MNLAQHILVVEDSDDDFATVLDAARRAGVAHPIRRASSGDEGLRLLRESVHAPGGLPLCYACGANAYHVKPVQHGAHLKVLEQVFDNWLTQVILPSHQSAAR